MTGCVPNLQLYFLVFIVFNAFVGVKYSRFIQLGEFVLCPCDDNRGLSNCCVANKDQFNLVLVFLSNLIISV